MTAHQEAMVRQVTYADSHRRERVFEKNQQVLVHRDHVGTQAADGQPNTKLHPRWIGPYNTLDVLSPTTVKLAFRGSCPS